ncbi:hypothetical protein DY000_02031632 [Brassica cretica]|uniref:Uncharacterized protein n=1 Tax=Brassica cretica TaxID=69181 RepID=A0ABQ7DY63_BRACR|nr:hypothetical protein DY000_02031632 [Brassica cretica]
MTSATPSRARILAMGSGPLRPMPLIAAHYVVFDAVFPDVDLPSRAVPWFADFVSSPLPSLFSHLVAAFITARISGGSHFRYVFQSRLLFITAYLPFSISQFVSLVPLIPLPSGDYSSSGLLSWFFVLVFDRVPLCFLAKILYDKVR